MKVSARRLVHFALTMPMALAWGDTALAQEFFRPRQAMTPALWAEDVRVLVEELEQRHVNPYPGIEPAMFRIEAKGLQSRLMGLGDDQTVIGIATLAARVGEGHTGVLPFDDGIDDRRLPVEFMADSQGIYIFAATPEFRKLIGARLVGIGDMAVAEIAAQLVPIMPRDNEFTPRKLLLDYLRVTGLLHAIGAAKDADSIPLTLRTDGHALETIVLSPIRKAADASIDWQFAQEADALPLWLRNRGEKYWSIYLPETRSVYVQFNSADIGRGEPEEAFIAFTDALVRKVEENAAESLILDLRWNTGGSLPRSFHLLHALIRADRVNRPGGLFVLIGNRTFSAASSLATLIGRHTDALFVGEPTGGKPSSYGDLRRLRLPNSGLTVRYSSQLSDAYRGTDLRPAVFPDLRANLAREDYLNGVDPWLEAVRAHGPRTPIGEHVRHVLDARGIDVAIDEFRRARRDDFNRYRFDATELNRLGYALLEEGRPHEAVAIFELNVETYPWEAYILDSLADGYFATGDHEAAMEMLRRTFEMDRSYPRWRDLMLDG